MKTFYKSCCKLLLCFSLICVFTTHKANAQWGELGGINALSAHNSIYSILSDAIGNIYAAGVFPNASGNTYVAKWDGTSWSELGGSNSLAANGPINSICKGLGGNAYAAGGFKNTSGNWYVAKWDGTSWSELGGSNSLSANGPIFSICSDTSGNIYAAGDFINASGKMYVAKWDGTSWSELGGSNSSITNNNILSICSDMAGNIYTAGEFTNASGKYFVNKWNGSTWSELGGNNALAANNPILTICKDKFNNIYAAGKFENGTNHYVAKWDGNIWSELGGSNAIAANGYIETICSDLNGNIYAAGLFKNLNNKWYVAKYNGTLWSELGGINSLGANSNILAICSDNLNNIYSGGSFDNGINFYVAKYSPCTPTTSTSTTTSCDSLWWNGVKYTTSGTYIDTILNAAGCDSIMTLNLTINNSSASTTTTTSCDSLWWNGVKYTTSGTYFDTIPNAAGCDSIMTLNLTINKLSTIPTIIATGSTSFCNGDSVTLSAAISYEWLLKANFGGTSRYGATGFSIAGKIYIGTGYDGTNYFNDFWEYDPATNIWTAKANFPGAARYFATGFSVNGKGYIGTGTNGVNNFNDFWEYNPKTDIWEHKNDFAGTQRYGAVAFNIGNNGYIGTGFDGAYKNDFWQYDPIADSWIAKANFGGNPRYYAAAFSIGSKGYIGTGFDGVYYNDFWEYDTTANNWTQKANFGGTARYAATGFSTDSKGYITTGYDGSSNKDDFWEYNVATDIWKPRLDFKGTSRYGATGVSIGNNVYLANGNIGASNSNELWQYEQAFSYSWNLSGATTPAIVAKTTGNYTVTATSTSTGCGATSISTAVTVKASTTSTTTTNACDSLWWNGVKYTTSGTFTFTTTNAAGCDSTATLNLTINHPTASITTTTSCDSLWWNGVKYTTSGIYFDTIPNVAGCDSTMTLNLVITNSSTSITTTTSCDSLWWNGTKYTSSGTYIDTILNAAGCDSIMTLNLTINYSGASTFTASACGSYTWALNSKVYTSSNHTDTVHLTTINGCDSLVTLDLTILSNITDVHINGIGAFCGDTATTQLSTNINYTYGSVSYEWIRLGYNEDTWQIVGHDSTLNISITKPAQYVVKTDIAGCGTFYSNQQTVMPVQKPIVALTPTSTVSICNNNVVNFTASSADSGVNNYAFYNGSSLVQSGSTLNYTTPTLTTANDGVVYKVEATNLKPTFDGNITENFWGSPLAVSTFGPSPSFGAGHELNAVYARADADNLYLAIAGNVQDQNRIMVFIDSKSGGYNTGNYGRTGLGNNGIKNFNSGSIFDPGFNADYCLGIGTDATRSQFYVDLFTLGGNATAGGGSNNYIGSNLSPASGYSIGANPANISQTQGFEIAIPKSALGYTSGDIRIFLVYSADNGFLSNQFLTRANVGAGNYGNGIINFALATPNPIDIPVGSLQNSCKTIVATTVTVKPNLTSTSTQSACDSFAWNGTTHFASGTYTFTSIGSNGCDSIATLALTINHPTTSTTTTGACDSLVWNGVTYKVDGTYTFNTTSSAGCDSVATLNLTINHPTTSTTTTSSCDSMLWGTTAYYTSGIYSYTTTGSNGCDSVATLNLTINNAPAKPTITTYPTTPILAGTFGNVFSCSPVSNAVSYQWSYTGVGAVIHNNGDTTITVDFTTFSTGVMQVIAISVNGCNSEKDTVTVNLYVTPVVLSNFSVEKLNKTALVKWTTATEVNNKNFEVQRSIDGRNFETIGVVAAKGFASEYSFLDPLTINHLPSTIYYRLKQVDNDGKYALSSVRTLNFKPETLSITIYPNPVKDVLNIKVANGEAKQVRILNTLGKIVFSKQIINNHLSIINVQQLKAGTYFVEITTNDGSKQIEKFVKN